MSSVLQTLHTGIRGVLGLSKATLNLEPLPAEAVQQRRKICAGCPAATRTKRVGMYNLHVLTPTSTCSVCRCNLQAKTRLAGETCPRYQWPAEG